jgi:hypothetical protein
MSTRPSPRLNGLGTEEPPRRLIRVIYERVSSMRQPSLSPSLVPTYHVNVYIVLDDFGKVGKAYRETDEAEATLEDVIENLISGQYRHPLRVVGFNTSEGWSRDVSEDVAWEVLRRLRAEGKMTPSETRDFLEFHVGAHEVAMWESYVI